MIERTPPRPVHFEGARTSAPLRVDAAADIAVIGALFRGAIRQLCFDHTGALLVLAGRGVRRLDPRTLRETGRWLPDRHVLAVHPCGDRLWVIVDDNVHLAAFGGDLGAPRAAAGPGLATASGTRLALVTEHGARLLDADADAPRSFTIDEAWRATLRTKRPPDRALLSPSGRRIGVTREHGGDTVVWDVETGAQLFAREHTESSALLDDDHLIHTDHGMGSLLKLSDGSFTRLPSDEHFRDVAQVQDGKFLAADANGGFTLYDVATRARLAALASVEVGHGRITSTVCAAFSAAHVASYAGITGTLRVTPIGGGETVESTDWAMGGETLTIGRGGDRVAVFREWCKGRLECVDLATAQIQDVFPASEDFTVSGVTADGDTLVLACGSILRARTVYTAAFFGGPESTKSHAIKSCVHELVNYAGDAYAISTYTLRGSGYVGLHKASSARAVAKLTQGDESPWRIAIGHGGDELLVAWESATILYDLSKRPKPLATWAHRAGVIALGPRGFAVLSLSGRELLLRVPGAAERRLTLPDRGDVTCDRLAFSRDGALLGVGRSDGVLELRRAADGELLRELPVHAGGFTDLQCRGDALWSLGADGQVCVLGLPPAA